MADANSRINLMLEKIVFGTIAICVPAIAGFQWQLWKSNQEALALLKSHDSRIAQLELNQSMINGRMVTWDVLKRIEIYMSMMNRGETDAAIQRAIRAEMEQAGK